MSKFATKSEIDKQLQPGVKFHYEDALGGEGEFEVLRRYQERGGDFVDMRAICGTLEKYKAELENHKRKNPHLESVQKLDLETFATNQAIEIKWFHLRNITFL